MNLLNESEVAKILRCSREKIKRLRLSGRISYIPGRPVLIDEEDLKTFVETLKTRNTVSAETPPSRDLARQPEDARKWALEQVLLRRRGRNRP